jgi:hypothetical protein
VPPATGRPEPVRPQRPSGEPPERPECEVRDALRKAAVGTIRAIHSGWRIRSIVLLALLALLVLLIVRLVLVRLVLLIALIALIALIVFVFVTAAVTAAAACCVARVLKAWMASSVSLAPDLTGRLCWSLTHQSAAPLIWLFEWAFPCPRRGHGGAIWTSSSDRGATDQQARTRTSGTLRAGHPSWPATATGM